MPEEWILLILNLKRRQYKGIVLLEQGDASLPAVRYCAVGLRGEGLEPDWIQSQGTEGWVSSRNVGRDNPHVFPIPLPSWLAPFAQAGFVFFSSWDPGGPSLEFLRQYTRTLWLELRQQLASVFLFLISFHPSKSPSRLLPHSTYIVIFFLSSTTHFKISKQ